MINSLNTTTKKSRFEPIQPAATSTKPTASPAKTRPAPVDKIEKNLEELKYCYAQYVLGARSLLEMNPPQLS